MAELFVCKICGEPYFGGSAPDDCPFCGAPKAFIANAREYAPLWGCELNEQDKTNLNETLALEVNATAYYLKVAKANKKYSRIERLYKQFARVENEHADVAAKFLGVEVPALVGEEPKGSLEADLARTRELEAHAVELYKGFAQRASNAALKKLYAALVHAESGHHDFVDAELNGACND
ncbi:MAG: ferritin family protein [Candidatus Micrarchaeia archaeon]